MRWYTYVVAGLVLIAVALAVTLPLVYLLGDDEEEHDWVELDAACNDGSRAHMYVRRRRGGSWLVMLEGGSHCTDHESCQNRARRHPSLVSSVWQNISFAAGIFASPTFSKHNLIWVPYCSSDSWIGNGARDGFEFRGAQIVDRVFDWIADREPTSIVFGGRSAGGRGALYNLDRVCARFENLDSCLGIHDAAWWVPGTPIAERLKEAYHYWSAEDPSRAATSLLAGSKLGSICQDSPHNSRGTVR
jgi:hypothetical protein